MEFDEKSLDEQQKAEQSDYVLKPGFKEEVDRLMERLEALLNASKGGTIVDKIKQRRALSTKRSYFAKARTPAW